MKFCIILGTRPEIIKLASLIRACEDRGIDFFVLHTNQHYSKNLDKVFFKELKLPKPKYNLRIGSGAHGKQTGLMIQKIEEILLIEKPDCVFVQGDTNSVLSGAIAASKLTTKICHIEAGLRSYDRLMPEEINRIVTDHVSDYLCCPTSKQKEILIKEGIDSRKIKVTGNTIVDAVYYVQDNADLSFFSTLNLKDKGYILLTLHRPANVDNKKILKKHLTNVSKLGKENDLDIIFPVHPRTLKSIEDFKISIPGDIKIIKPTSFVEMISLEKHAKIILTDSGGMQEEGCILGTPTLNLRENTERPECVEVGSSIIVGSDYSKLEKGFTFFNKGRHWIHPFGDGKSYDKILNFVKDEI